MSTWIELSDPERDLAKQGVSDCDPERFTSVIRVGAKTPRVLKLNIQKIEIVSGVSIVSGEK